MKKRRFCICCGEDVDTNPVKRGGKVELTCIFCGFTLEIIASRNRQRARCIITVEDSEITRGLIEKLLVEKELADEIIGLKNGKEFVTTISRRFPDGEPIDLVILDIEMPEMNGFTAARFLRTVEKKFDREPCPIIFFSGHKADEDLKKQMNLYRPVRYLNKGAAGDTEELMRRVQMLVSHLITLIS